MGLLTEESEVALTWGNVYHFEELGYEIPKNDKGKFKHLATITVKTKDLTYGSYVKVKIKCDNCGKESYVAYKDYVKRNHNGLTYCQPCTMRVLLSGENSVNYNKELTDEDRIKGRHRINNEIHIATWSKKIMARDNYTCQKCGKRGGINLVAHHIDSYDWCKEKRTDMTNGVTLCENCHKTFHSLYGYGQNTKEQFEEWFDKSLDDILKEFDGEIPKTKPIVCLETGKIITNSTEFCKEKGWQTSTLRNACYTGTLLKHQHYMYYDKYKLLTNSEIENIIKSHNGTNNVGRKLVQLDLETREILAIYNCQKDAATVLVTKYKINVKDKRSLSYCANHVYKYCYGYKWEWFDYYCENIDTETKPSELLRQYLIEVS